MAAAANTSFDIFTHDTASSAAVELLAEEGNPSLLLNAAAAAQTAGNVSSFAAIHPGSPLMPGESTSVVLTADTAHRWFTYAMMLGVTNDAFIGSAIGTGDQQIDLFQGGVPLIADFHVPFLNVWDAGTEVNTELAAHITALGGTPGAGTVEGGVLRSPHNGILGVGQVPLSLDWYGRDVARIQITPVPEPATFAAVTFGLLALARRRKSSSHK
jgi:hypothetical protein